MDAHTRRTSSPFFEIDAASFPLSRNGVGLYQITDQSFMVPLAVVRTERHHALPSTLHLSL
ncbi:hypothetical protein CGRA01v4_05752 [Colletotrichum graminicola]|nr:hypothetical protein CGRA01v4_05752 [Colletotrichum graminicola]